MSFYDNQQNIEKLKFEYMHILRYKPKKSFISNVIFLLQPYRYHVNVLIEASVELSPSHEITWLWAHLGGLPCVWWILFAGVFDNYSWSLSSMLKSKSAMVCSK